MQFASSTLNKQPRTPTTYQVLTYWHDPVTSRERMGKFRKERKDYSLLKVNPFLVERVVFRVRCIEIPYRIFDKRQTISVQARKRKKSMKFTIYYQNCEIIRVNMLSLVICSYRISSIYIVFFFFLFFFLWNFLLVSILV